MKKWIYNLFIPHKRYLKVFCFKLLGIFWPPIPKICHTYPTMMKLDTVIPYLRKIQKIYKSRNTSLKFCWHQHFFTGNQQILLFQEIQIWIGFWYIISNSFNFSWVFNNCFEKHGYNFDDARKNAIWAFLK